MIIRIIY